MHSVIFLNPDGTALGAFTVESLQRMQWFGTDADYRKTLPRLDPSPLAVLR
jgi:hypothetical protein